MQSEYSFQCCYCGKMFKCRLIATHVQDCLEDYQNGINATVTIPKEYQNLFDAIKKSDSNSNCINKRYVDEFNSNAWKIFKDLAKRKTDVGVVSYHERLKYIQPILDCQNVDCLDVLKKLGQFFSHYISLQNLCEDTMLAECFICAKQINFWEYHLHTNACLSENSSVNEIEIPNLNVLLEIINEISKGKRKDKNYITFLLQQFNLESDNIHLKYSLSSKKKRVVFNDNTNTNTNSKTNQSDVILCYICGVQFLTDGFEIHYSNCKLSYTNSKVNKDKPLKEPPILGEIVNKLVFGMDIQAELEEYNELAEKLHEDLISLQCGICKKTFHPDVFLQHHKMCMRQKKKSMSQMEFNDNSLKMEDHPRKKDIDENKLKRIRKKSMDDIKNYDVRQIKTNIKHYFI